MSAGISRGLKTVFKRFLANFEQALFLFFLAGSKAPALDVNRLLVGS